MWFCCRFPLSLSFSQLASFSILAQPLCEPHPLSFTGPIKYTASQMVKQPGNKVFDRTSALVDHTLTIWHTAQTLTNVQLNLLLIQHYKWIITAQSTLCSELVFQPYSYPHHRNTHTTIYFTSQCKCLLFLLKWETVRAWAEGSWPTQQDTLTHTIGDRGAVNWFMWMEP